MKRFFIYLMISVICVFTVFMIVSCQDVFTTGLFSFMQTDPADMSRSELIRYGWDVIATGDNKKMLEAYNAVKDMYADNTDDGELAYLAAKLRIEMSGLADFMINPPDETIIAEYKSELNSVYIMEAADFFVIADSNDMVLNAIDKINCGIGLLLFLSGGNFTNMETVDIANPGAQEVIGAGYITEGTDSLGPDFYDLVILAFFTVIP
ncbi:MAG: hypothetical protein JXJ04_22595 [Spirochaetales bacterium]|nr:hypothetical protein [Spirochaetales bacterium]